MKSKITSWGFWPLLLVVLLVAACKKEHHDGGGSKTATVSISGFKFTPASVTVAANGTVTWTNNDDAPHTVTADDDSFTSATLNKGDTYSHTFTTAGTVAYHCGIHPSMTASVVVQ